MTAVAPRRRIRDPVATKRRLLEAAQTEFAAHGFQGARLRDIAKRAGVQPALIHHYFDDKEGLYRAMLDAAFAEPSSLSWDILDQVPDFPALVDGFVTMLLAYHDDQRELISILRRESAAGSPASSLTEERVVEHIAPIIDAVVGVISDEQTKGTVRADLDPRELVLTSLSMCAYPFLEEVFLAACIPGGLVQNEAGFARRKARIVEVVMRQAAPPKS